MSKLNLSYKDLVFISFYLIVAMISYLSITFEPMYGDLIVFCLALHIAFVVPAFAIVKGYIK